MEKDTKGKKFKISFAIKAGLVIVFIAVFFAVGAMAYNGFVKPDRREALRLLAQIPERISWSAQNDYIGTGEMLEKYLDEGGQVDVSVSDITPGDILGKSLTGGEGPTEIFPAMPGMLSIWESLSEYTVGWNKKFDMDSGRTSQAVMLSKGGEKMSVIRCQDSTDLWVALPELLDGKVLHAKTGELGGILGEGSGAEEQKERDFLNFFREIKVFLAEESVKAADQISFDKLKKSEEWSYVWDSGYTLQIPQEYVNSFFQRLSDLLCEQNQEVLQLLGEKVRGFSVARDITLTIYGEDGKLCQLETDIPIKGNAFKVTIAFTGEKDDSSISLLAQGEWEGELVSLMAKRLDKKKNVYETNTEIEIAVADETVSKLTCSEKISPNDASYQLDIGLDAEGQKSYQVHAKGAVKDVKKGVSASYVLDDLWISSGDEELMSMETRIQFLAGDQEISPPQGEIVEISPDTEEEDMEVYKREITENFSKKMARMGILNQFMNKDGLL